MTEAEKRAAWFAARRSFGQLRGPETAEERQAKDAMAKEWLKTVEAAHDHDPGRQ
jgi:hypothetical protein